jgi:hypothetical protein
MLKSKGRTARAQSAQRQGSGGRRPKAWSRAGVLGAVSVGVIALGAAFSVPASAAPAAAASGAAAASFKIFNPTSPSGGPFGSPEALTGLYAASPTDVWAVGQPAGDQFEHWNGTKWTGQGLPAGLATAPGNSAGVKFITGTSASNITAVGTGDINTGAGTIVAESVAFHFNGTAWSEMTIPANVELGPVLAFSATNLWSVNDNGDAEHFNGTTWTATSLPITTTLPVLDLTSISGSSPSDIWAAGSASNGDPDEGTAPILEHFNGTSWSNVTVPVSIGLTDVADISPADAYAVTLRGEILHWNGTTWTALNATTQTGTAVTGSAVAALSPADVWIAGLNTLDNFNGTTWTSVPVPATTRLTPAGQTLAAPDAAAAVGPGTVWFAGNTFTPASDTSNSELPFALGTSNG